MSNKKTTIFASLFIALASTACEFDNEELSYADIDGKPGLDRYAVPADFAPGEDGSVLDVTHLRQEQSGWCWASVATMVLRASGMMPDVRQCDVVQAALESDVARDEGIGLSPGTDCCDPETAAAAECNRGYDPGYAALELGVEVGYKPRALTEVELQWQLDQGHLVGPGIYWTDRVDGHAVLVSGYAKVDDAWTYLVQDPSARATVMRSYDDLVTGLSFNAKRPATWEVSYIFEI